MNEVNEFGIIVSMGFGMYKTKKGESILKKAIFIIISIAVLIVLFSSCTKKEDAIDDNNNGNTTENGSGTVTDSKTGTDLHQTYDKTAYLTGKISIDDVKEVSKLIPEPLPQPETITPEPLPQPETITNEDIGVVAIISRSDLLQRSDLIQRSDIITRSDFYKSIETISDVYASNTTVNENGEFTLEVPSGEPFYTMVVIKSKNQSAFKTNHLKYLKYEEDKFVVGAVISTIKAEISDDEFDSEINISEENFIADLGTLDYFIDEKTFIGDKKIETPSSKNLRIILDCAKNKLIEVLPGEEKTCKITLNQEQSGTVFYAGLNLPDFVELKGGSDNTATLTIKPGADIEGTYSGIKLFAFTTSSNSTFKNESSEADEILTSSDISIGVSAGPVKLSLGTVSSCVLFKNGKVKCWGSGVGNQPYEMGKYLPTVDLGTDKKAIDFISTYSTASCVLFEDGTVKCLDNTEFINFGTNKKVTSISSDTFSQACAILNDGSVKCWNGKSILGYGDTNEYTYNDLGDNRAPIDLGTNQDGSSKKALSVVCGFSHICALLDDLTVRCWGTNSYGVLGSSTTEIIGDEPDDMGNYLTNIDFGSDKYAVSIASMGSSMCAILNDNTVKCWGRNDNGQLGLGDTQDRGAGPSEMGDNLPPIDFGSVENKKILYVATGYNHACAIFNDGSIKCWGSNGSNAPGANGSGLLGLGDVNARGDEPNEMGDNLPFLNLGSIGLSIFAAGGFHTCTIFIDQKVKCWGWNADGQLGLGDNENRGDESDEVPSLLPYVDVGSP